MGKGCCSDTLKDRWWLGLWVWSVRGFDGDTGGRCVLPGCSGQRNKASKFSVPLLTLQTLPARCQVDC